jgi:1-acyl-sn-glycerol-3-phosphate acyltransferase
MDRFISVLYLIFICMTCIILFFGAFLVWAITVLFDRRLFILHKYTCFWGSVYTWCMPAWPVHILDRHNAKKSPTYVIVSNHQSQLDILVLFRLFIHFKWVSKEEIFKVPFVGWNMALNRYIRLKRGVKESIQKMMDDCERTLAQGNSVFIFPEGTRSPDGILKPFKAGAFILAKKLKLPILPIAVSGTKEALPKHSMNFHGRHHIYVKVLPEIAPESFENETVEELAERVRATISGHVKAS